MLLGGVLTDLLSWEWIFYVNVPVGIAALALTPFLIAESRDTTAESFDIPGAVLVTSGLVVLVYAITQANDYGWSSVETIGLFTAAAALIGSFLAWESRAKDPLMPFSIFRLRTLVGANIAGLILGTAMFGMFLMLTLYMQQVLGLLAAEDRRRVPGGRRHGDLLVRSRRAARDANRRQAGARRRDGDHDGRPRLLHPGLRRRLVSH